jgi:hypothetical protein
MAGIFVSKRSASIGNVLTKVGDYTVAANTRAVVVGLTVSNTSNVSVYANVAVNDGTNNYYIVKNAPIPAEGALVVVGGRQKLVLQTDDSIKINSSGVDSLSAIFSAMEFDYITPPPPPPSGGIEGDLMTLSGSEDLMSGTGVEDLSV